MKNTIKKITLSTTLLLIAIISFAQCSICTKTASQIGEEAGKGFNAGILYLAAMPFGVMGYIAFRWWKAKIKNSPQKNCFENSKILKESSCIDFVSAS